MLTIASIKSLIKFVVPRGCSYVVAKLEVLCTKLNDEISISHGEFLQCEKHSECGKG